VTDQLLIMYGILLQHLFFVVAVVAVGHVIFMWLMKTSFLPVK